MDKIYPHFVFRLACIASTAANAGDYASARPDPSAHCLTSVIPLTSRR